MEGVEVKGTGGRSTGSSGSGRCVEVEGGGEEVEDTGEEKETDESLLMAKIARWYCIMITLVTYIHLYPYYLKVP